MMASKNRKDYKSDFFEVPEEGTREKEEAGVEFTADEDYKLEDSEVSNFRKKKFEAKDTTAEDAEPTVIKTRSAVRHLRAETATDDLEDDEGGDGAPGDADQRAPELGQALAGIAVDPAFLALAADRLDGEHAGQDRTDEAAQPVPAAKCYSAGPFTPAEKIQPARRFPVDARL